MGRQHERTELQGHGQWGVGPPQFREASFRWARRVTFHADQSGAIYHVCWVHLARQYNALPTVRRLLWTEISVPAEVCSKVRIRAAGVGGGGLV